MRLFTLVAVTLLSFPLFTQSDYSLGSFDLTTGPSREQISAAPHAGGSLLFADDYDVGRLYHLVDDQVTEVYAGVNERIYDGGAVATGRLIIIAQLDEEKGDLWLLSAADNSLTNLNREIGNLSWHVSINDRQLLVTSDQEIIGTNGTESGTEVIYTNDQIRERPGQQGELAFGRQIIATNNDMLLTDGTAAGTEVLLTTPGNTLFFGSFFSHLDKLYYNRAGVHLDEYQPESGEWVTISGANEAETLSPELYGLGKFEKTPAGLYAWGQSQTVRPSFYFTDGTPERTFRLVDSTGTEDYLSDLSIYTNSATNIAVLKENLPFFEPYDRLFVSAGTPETTQRVMFDGQPWEASYYRKVTNLPDGLLISGFDSLQRLVIVHETPTGVETEFIYAGPRERSFIASSGVTSGDYTYVAYIDQTRQPNGDYTVTQSGYAIINSANRSVSFSVDESAYEHTGEEVLTVTPTHLLYAAKSLTSGLELYAIAHGTNEAVLVADINPGAAGSFPTLVNAEEAQTIIVAFDDQNGNQVYTTDGTSSGTQLLAELNDHIGSTSVRQLSAGTDDLFIRNYLGDLNRVDTDNGASESYSTGAGYTHGTPVMGGMVQVNERTYEWEYVSADTVVRLARSWQNFSNTVEFDGKLSVLVGGLLFEQRNLLLLDLFPDGTIDTVFETVTVLNARPRMVGSGRDVYFFASDLNTGGNRIFHRSEFGVNELEVDLEIPRADEMIIDQQERYLVMAGLVDPVPLTSDIVVFDTEGTIVHRLQELPRGTRPQRAVSLQNDLLIQSTTKVYFAPLATEGEPGELFTAPEQTQLSGLTILSFNLAAFMVSATDGSTSQLYLTDGTPEGTREVASFTGRFEDPERPGVAPAGIPRVGNWLSFIIRYEDGASELKLFNEATEELFTVTEPDSYPREVVVKDNRFYFSMRDEAIGRELFYLDFGFNQSNSGIVFHDQNNNGEQDNDEPGLASQRLEITGPDGTIDYVFTDQNGAYSQFYLDGEEYSVTVLPDDCWEVTTGSDTESFTGSSAATSPAFGLNLAPATAPGIATFLSASVLRCNTAANLWVQVNNDGCASLEDVTLTLTLLHDEVTVVSAEGDPETNDNVLTWTVDVLPVGENRMFRVEVELPDEEATGELIEFMALATDGEVSDDYSFATDLRCAYDPNDKLVSPARPEESNSNYTQVDETLTYTIRFQNTGNDTAINVRLEDQLDPALDWTTFRPRAASHRNRAFLSDDGLLRVFFDDIFLPDSNVNLVGSNGFFAFDIDLKPEALDRTVSNTAGIYFDFNAPIITNTVTNTVVEFLDEDEDGYFFWDECDDEDALINPAAVDVFGNGIDENCDGEDGIVSTSNPLPGTFTVRPNPASSAVWINYSLPTELRVDLFDGRGRRVQSMGLKSEGRFDVSNLPSALYQLRFVDVATGQTTVRRLVVN